MVTGDRASVRSSSLRRRLLLLILFTMVPDVGVVLYGAAHYRQSESVEVRDDATRLARLVAVHEDDAIAGTRQLLSTLAELQNTDGVAPRCASVFAAFVDQHARYLNLEFVKPDGRIACSANPARSSRNPLDRPDVQQTFVTRSFSFSPDTADPNDEPLVFRAAYPVVRQDGRLNGVVAATLHPDMLTGVVPRLALPRTAVLSLVDATGTIVGSYPGPRQSSRRSAISRGLIQAMKEQGDTGSFEAQDVDGARRIHAFTRLNSLAGSTASYYIVVGIPREGAYTSANRGARDIVALLLAVTVAALGAAWLAADRAVLRPVSQLLETTDSLRKGNLATRTRLPHGDDEFGRLAWAFDRMAESLERRNAALEAAHSQLRTLSGRVVAAAEEERRRIARELHDEIGQVLTSVKINLQLLERLPDPLAAASRLTATISRVDEAIGDVRDLSLALRPPLLDELGLVAAVRGYLDHQARDAELTIRFSAEEPEARLSVEIETACFRIIQEAVTNVIRHAGTRDVCVTVACRNQGLELFVRDEGAGFDPASVAARRAAGQCVGLAGIEERVMLLGGRIHIESRPGAGTEVRAWLPIADAAATLCIPAGRSFKSEMEAS
jgi:signal transduction histidine kinase